MRAKRPPRPQLRSTADRISDRVLETSPDDEVDLGDAMTRLAKGVRKTVTFRRLVTVPLWSENMRIRETFGELVKVVIDAGTRGTIVSTMVDGRDLVRLYDGREVLARVGDDCRMLGRWFRLVDRLHRRRIV